MPTEEELALKCEHLAAKFECAAEKNDSKADEFSRVAVHRVRVAAEHPEALDLRADAEELMGVVAYWQERAAWDREIASKFRRRAEGHRARLDSDLVAADS
ncbi:hypothetical protein [Paludisphaera rhizosphaerae]|uniref:hypothetical protein n=1 Tax=Paludisphaera rhizosphaerae TaxID=2711216 RepID=UPI00197CEEC6|nr:hypothetical protein [Paludisphaera rhizosphaerae]